MYSLSFPVNCPFSCLFKFLLLFLKLLHQFIIINMQVIYHAIEKCKSFEQLVNKIVKSNFSDDNLKMIDLELIYAYAFTNETFIH